MVYGVHLLLLKAKAVPPHAMKALERRGDIANSFSTSALDGCEWSASRPSRALAPEIIRTQVGKHNRSDMIAVYGTPCALPSRNNNSNSGG
jgi:hypothetical protein